MFVNVFQKRMKKDVNLWNDWTASSQTYRKYGIRNVDKTSEAVDDGMSEQNGVKDRMANAIATHAHNEPNIQANCGHDECILECEDDRPSVEIECIACEEIIEALERLRSNAVKASHQWHITDI